MDWTAFRLSLELGVLTVLALLPVSLLVGRWLAFTRFRWRSLVEAIIILPLVLPPTVMGFYLLAALGPNGVFGRSWEMLFGSGLAFSFPGIVIASILVNLPFAIQPAQRAFEAIGQPLREAAATCGMAPWTAFRRVELPLALPGVITGAVLVFAHTLGEFGVVLMVGGAIPGETRTLALSIYDRVQALDNAAAASMSLVLMAISLAAVAATFLLAGRRGRSLDVGP